MTKCLHEACFNEAEEMSSYCKDCVNLPIEKCNGCFKMQDNSSSKKPIKKQKNNFVKGEEDKFIRVEESKDSGDRFVRFMFRAILYVIAFVLFFNLLKMMGWFS